MPRGGDLYPVKGADEGGIFCTLVVARAEEALLEARQKVGRVERGHDLQHLGSELVRLFPGQLIPGGRPAY